MMSKSTIRIDRCLHCALSLCTMLAHSPPALPRMLQLHRRGNRPRLRHQLVTSSHNPRQHLGLASSQNPLHFLPRTVISLRRLLLLPVMCRRLVLWRRRRLSSVMVSLGQLRFPSATTTRHFQQQRRRHRHRVVLSSPQLTDKLLMRGQHRPSCTRVWRLTGVSITIGSTQPHSIILRMATAQKVAATYAVHIRLGYSGLA